MAEIHCAHLNKKYGTVEVVSDFNLHVEDHEFVVFLGPSGCGKSTILRMIAGLEDITGGELKIGGRVVNDAEPGDRGVAMVFQNYALYPHMSIRENIAFGLRRLKRPEAEIIERVDGVASMLGLETYLDRKPTELSGGQQQRVAIARAMIKTPDVFLFDEPLSNLDAKLRAHMRYEIARLHKKLHTTSVYVTHDQMEAMTLADRIVLLNEGNIEQVGTPEEIYQKPQSLFVAGFIGTPTMNLLEMTVAKSGKNWVLSSEGCKFPIVGDGFSLQDGQKVVLGFRPSKLNVLSAASGAVVIASGVVDMVEFHGDDILLGIDYGIGRVMAFVDAFQAPREGAQVGFSLDEQDMHLFDCETEQSLRKM